MTRLTKASLMIWLVLLAGTLVYVPWWIHGPENPGFLTGYGLLWVGHAPGFEVGMPDWPVILLEWLLVTALVGLLRVSATIFEVKAAGSERSGTEGITSGEMGPGRPATDSQR